MTLAESPHYDQLVEITADGLRARLPEALTLYVNAMRYPPSTAEQRAPMWLTHMRRDGWRCVGAVDSTGQLLGISYGYAGAAGQWWHDQVKAGLTYSAGASPATIAEWMDDYFELTELHVRPDCQGHGIGERLLRRLVSGVPNPTVLLSTPEGTGRAWRLYRRLGFVDVLRDYVFAGDPRPFAVLGRGLPLER